MKAGRRRIGASQGTGHDAELGSQGGRRRRGGPV